MTDQPRVETGTARAVAAGPTPWLTALRWYVGLSPLLQWMLLPLAASWWTGRQLSAAQRQPAIDRKSVV